MTFLLLPLLLLLYLYRRERIQAGTPVDTDTDIVYEYIDVFHIKNMFWTSFRAFIYFFTHIILLIILRYITLGKHIDIHSFNIFDYLTLKVFLSVLIYIGFIYQVLKLVEDLCYYDVLRLHIRFYSIYEIIGYRLQRIAQLPWEILLNLSIMPTYVISADLREHKDREIKETINTILAPSTWRLLIYKVSVFLYKLSLKFKVVVYLSLKLEILIDWLHRYTTAFIAQIHYILVVWALIYDLIHKELYWIFHALFIFILILIYRKLIKFISNTQSWMDEYLHKIFYEGAYLPYNVCEHNIEQLLQKPNRTKEEEELLQELFQIQGKYMDISMYLERVISYLFDNLQKGESKFHALTSYQPEKPFIVLPVRKLLFLAFSLFSLYYIFINKDTHIIFTPLGVEISYYVSVGLFGCLLIFLWLQNTYEGVFERRIIYKETIVRGSKYYLYSFWMLIFVINGFILYYLLSDHSAPFQLNIYDWLLVKENLSVADKIEYFYRFFELLWVQLLKSNLTYIKDPDEIILIIQGFKEANLHTFITNQTTLQELFGEAKRALGAWYVLQVEYSSITEAFVLEESNKLPDWITQIRKFGTVCCVTWFVGSIIVTIPIFIDVWYNPENVVMNILKYIFMP